MFRVQVEHADGTTWLGETEHRYPDEAEAVMEHYHRTLSGTGSYAAFRVLEQDGTVYSEWEC